MRRVGPEYEVEASSLTGRLARWASRHRALVVQFWILVGALALVSLFVVSPNTRSELGGTGESSRADAMLQEAFGSADDPVNEFVVISHPYLSVDDAEYRAFVEHMIDVASSIHSSSTPDQSLIANAYSHYDTGLPSSESPFAAITADGGQATFVQLQLTEDLDTATASIDELIERIESEARGTGFDVALGGEASVQSGLDELLAQDFAFASTVSLPVTFLILVLALGTLAAAAVPLAIGFAAVGISLGLLSLGSWLFDFQLHDTYAQAVLLVGLSAAVDYSIYLVIRYRQERRRGLPEVASVVGASATAGKAIFIAAITTGFALSSMFLLDESLFGSIALAAIVSVIVAVLMASTLIPAWLATAGDGIDRFGVPGLRHGFAAASRGGFLSGWINLMTRHPKILTIPAAIGLIALALPVVQLNLGVNGLRSFPSTAKGVEGLLDLEEDFSLGLVQPAIVVINPALDADVSVDIEQLEALIRDDSVSADNPNASFSSPLRLERSPNGNLFSLEVPLNAASGDEAAVEALHHLRDDLIPTAFDQVQAEVVVTGETARNVDFIDKVLGKLPIMVGFVLATSFVVLTIMYRSLVLPLVAIALNLLAVGGAFGILKLAFQDGLLLEGILDYQATGIIEVWVPLFVFAIVFGISFDDLTLALGRVKEEHENGADSSMAVSRGIKGVAMTIVAVDLILAGVVTIFAFLQIVFMKQLGVTMLVAVLLGAATVVAILMPGVLRLLGDRLWYLPWWLRWLPSVSSDDAKLRKQFPSR